MWRRPGFWIAALSLLGVLAFVLSDFGRTSPGPLTTVHGRDPRLGGGSSCAACHGGWFSDMQKACLACHQDIGEQLQSGRHLHGLLGKDRGAQCGACHSEHHGADFAMVNRQSFALAGIKDPAQFDHALVGFAMRGKHLQTACKDCHKDADARTLLPAHQRYLGLDKGCGSCHEDVHKGRMVLRCEQCHGQDSFKVLEPAGHERFLPLLGGHAKLQCEQCHQKDGPHGLEQLGTTTQRTARQCADCHDSPHGAAFLAGNSKAAGMSERAACVVCHAAEHTSFRDERLVLTPTQHARSGYPLTAPHDHVKCAGCHDAKADFATRYPSRSADACAKCHADPHGGQFRDGPFAAAGCLGCHDRLRFTPDTFDLQHHARSRFPLTGAHAKTKCHDCHGEPKPHEPRAFRGIARQCSGCHEDAHRGCFTDRASPPGGAAAGECDACHLTTAFSALPPGGFDHARFTGFAVRGAHAQTQCETCHPRSDKSDAQHRTFGRVADHFGTYTGCVTCHQDPHAGGFDKPGMAREVGGRRDCARCHAETSFRAFPDGFDHATWTGFPLAGAHARIDCSACHAVLFPAEPSGRTWARAKGKECGECHQDPHAGQFVVAGRTDCKHCHRTGATFADLSFRHELDSRFHLGDAHKNLPCAACHKPLRTGSVEVVRYKPLGCECTDCHGAQDDPLRPGRVRRG
jgi:Cytochrome c7 and related cytochrome c